MLKPFDPQKAGYKVDLCFSEKTKSYSRQNPHKKRAKNL
jgi:hypothetical protein